MSWPKRSSPLGPITRVKTSAPQPSLSTTRYRDYATLVDYLRCSSHEAGVRYLDRDRYTVDRFPRGEGREVGLTWAWGSDTFKLRPSVLASREKHSLSLGVLRVGFFDITTIGNNDIPYMAMRYSYIIMLM